MKLHYRSTFLTRISTYDSTVTSYYLLAFFERLPKCFESYKTAFCVSNYIKYWMKVKHCVPPSLDTYLYFCYKVAPIPQTELAFHIIFS